MGLQKVALNFMVERCGKLAKSLLCTKPQNITTIKSLKYAPLKTGILEFRGLKSTRQYAKDRAIDAIKSETPFERVIIIDKDKNKIVAELNGNQNNVSTKGIEISNNASVVHGHPTLKTMPGTSIATPISFSDFGVLNKNGSDIIAFNTAGEFSMLAKKPNFKPLSKEQFYYYGQIHSTYIVYENDFIPKIVSKLPIVFQNCKSRQEIKLVLKELETKFGLSKKEILYIKAKCMQVVKDMLGLDEVKGIHKFWQDYADELGVIYKTNYSYLK